MILEIIKKSNWKKVFITILDKNHLINKKIELIFDEDKTTVEFELDKDYFFFLSNDEEYETEVVIISPNMEKIYLDYNKIKKEHYIYFDNTYNYYNEAISFVLKDEKNLFFRPDKSKIIDIIIPKNYDINKKYGLLIMFDGQNLYDKNNVGNYTDKNDPYGSWQVDVSMSMLNKTLGKEFIVVGIEHTDILRTNELLPPATFGSLKAEGLIEEHEKTGYIDHLDSFINETLLPYLTSKYSIDSNNIGISGSSMGGLGSHYIGLKNLGKYKFILCYTPASALIEDSAWDNFYKKLDFINNISKLPLFYFFQGKGDDLEKILALGNQNLTKLMIENAYPKELIKEYIEESAMHNEVCWRYAFNYMIYHTFK